MSDLVGRDRKLPVNKAKIHKAKPRQTTKQSKTTHRYVQGAQLHTIATERHRGGALQLHTYRNHNYTKQNETNQTKENKTRRPNF